MATVWRPVSSAECIRLTRVWWSRTTKTTETDADGKTVVTWSAVLENEGMTVPVYRIRGVGPGQEATCEVNALLWPLRGSDS